MDTPTSTATATATPIVKDTPTSTATASATPTATPTASATPTPQAPSTITPTPVSTPVQCLDHDADTICDDLDPDDDGDGCPDVAELQPAANADTGGGRDPLYFWDVMDVPVGMPPERDKAITIGDIGGVVARFGATRVPAPSKAEAYAEALTPPAPAPAYHPAFDRDGAIPGQDTWDLLPPNGAINTSDIGAAVAQFGHSCA